MRQLLKAMKPYNDVLLFFLGPRSYKTFVSVLSLVLLGITVWTFSRLFHLLHTIGLQNTFLFLGLPTLAVMALVHIRGNRRRRKEKALPKRNPGPSRSSSIQVVDCSTPATQRTLAGIKSKLDHFKERNPA